MELNSDLDLTAHQSGDELAWQPSPMAGVERAMLDRVGDEVAVATTIVRYAPESYFDAHGHALGEEFIVLEGVFSDEHGDYPAGSYIRNPPGTAHTPHSKEGCVIFVKLRQFADEDLTPVQTAISADIEPGEPHQLYRYVEDEKEELVESVLIPKGERFAFSAHQHARELFILSGSVTWQQDVTRTLGPWSWIRIAPGDPLRVNALEDTLIFAKTRPVYRDAAA